ncbi:MAG: hypothetical protein B7Z08_08120 [Sphingomonadales bacterium 32-68-7]|nr:MAG: hypothetical protein B7Z33_10240 [Sphingomonadales bacterium 12-68-11]OYX08740.1 MAG: hypothetical protein B7Z08_08120 [Sphingomonadales bacterium 32-68-7]
MIDRRELLCVGLGTLVAGCLGTRPQVSGEPEAALAALEARSGGRLGACIIDTATGRTAGWRSSERFAHCSSFKLSLAALVLQGAQAGRWQLDHRLHWTQGDLMGNSPVTSAHVAEGLTAAELARATLVTSDNAAANVLLRWLGGPQAMTAFWAAIGDTTSRLDRLEPDLNVVPPGSVLDTTTPAAMAATVARLVTGDVLDEAGRAMLMSWMVEVQTGTRRLRAGFPAGWVAGDKTGTGLHPQSTIYVDLAFGGPAPLKGSARAPLVVAAYFVPPIGGGELNPAFEGVLAEVGAITAATIASEPIAAHAIR